MSLPTSFFHTRVPLGGGQFALFFGENSSTAFQDLAGSITKGEGARYNDTQQAFYMHYKTNAGNGYEGSQAIKIDIEGNVTDLGKINRGSTGNWESRAMEVLDNEDIIFLSESGGTSYASMWRKATNTEVTKKDWPSYRYIFASKIFESGGQTYLAVCGRTLNGEMWTSFHAISSTTISNAGNSIGSNTLEYGYEMMYDQAADGMYVFGRTNTSPGERRAGFIRYSGSYNYEIGRNIKTLGVSEGWCYSAVFRGGERNCYNDTSLRNFWAVGLCQDSAGHLYPWVGPGQPNDWYTTDRALYTLGAPSYNGNFYDVCYQDVKPADKIYCAGEIRSGETGRSGINDGIIACLNVDQYGSVPSIDRIIGFKQIKNSIEKQLVIYNIETDHEGFIMASGRYYGQTNDSRAFVVRLNPDNPYAGAAGPITIFDATSNHALTNGGSRSLGNNNNYSVSVSNGNPASNTFQTNQLPTTSLVEL